MQIGLLTVYDMLKAADSGKVMGNACVMEKHGGKSGDWPVWVSGNWRMTFAFKGEDAELIDYSDDH